MVITGRRNGESRSSKFKKAPADLADFGRFFTENPKNFKKQTGKHRVNDGQAPFRNTVGIGVFPKKHRFLNEFGGCKNDEKKRSFLFVIFTPQKYIYFLKPQPFS